jgi:hypothetical protein
VLNQQNRHVGACSVAAARIEVGTRALH